VTASPAPRSQLPPRLLPVLYFGVAHVAFASASLAVACDPRGVSGFFYRSRMLAIVHLVTLGWITASILGSLYVVGPVALRVWIPATWLDYTARLLPLFAWYWAYANTGYKGPVPSQHDMSWRTGQELALVLWLFGVPALAALLLMPSRSSAPPHGACWPRPLSTP
jgi:hypothetical protein